MDLKTVLLLIEEGIMLQFSVRLSSFSLFSCALAVAFVPSLPPLGVDLDDYNNSVMRLSSALPLVDILSLARVPLGSLLFLLSFSLLSQDDKLFSQR